MNYSRYLHFRLDFTQAAFRKVPRFPCSVPHFHPRGHGLEKFCTTWCMSGSLAKSSKCNSWFPVTHRSCGPRTGSFFREISGQLDWIEFSMGFFQCFFQWDLPGHGVLKGVFQWESIGDSIGFHGNLNRKHH